MANSGGDILKEEEHLHLGVDCGVTASPTLDPAVIMEEKWSAAEEAAEHVLNWVHPTLDSEEKRRDVVDYVQQLVKSRLNCEVVNFFLFLFFFVVVLFFEVCFSAIISFLMHGSERWSYSVSSLIASFV